MSDRIDDIAAKLSTDSKVDERREAALELHDIGMRSRRSLEKRGTLSKPAESPAEFKRAVAETLKVAISDPDPEVRLHAVDAAGHLGDSRLVESLEAKLREDQPEIRMAAIRALGEIGGPSGIQTLAEVVESKTEDEEARFAALNVLEELTAKHITSGPDRRFNPVEATPESLATDTPTIESAMLPLVDTLRKVVSDKEETELFRLKAQDSLAYLLQQGGI